MNGTSFGYSVLNDSPFVVIGSAVNIHFVTSSASSRTINFSYSSTCCASEDILHSYTLRCRRTESTLFRNHKRHRFNVWIRYFIEYSAASAHYTRDAVCLDDIAIRYFFCCCCQRPGLPHRTGIGSSLCISVSG